MIFECHHVPNNLKNEITDFLRILELDDTFLSLLNEKTPSLKIIEINFLTEKEIQVLNLNYRSLDKPTDVLSFNLEYSGELDLCLNIIKLNADGLNINFLQELFRCIIHGCLHIFGFDHFEKLTPENIASEPMFLIQEEILKNVAPSCL